MRVRILATGELVDVVQKQSSTGNVFYVDKYDNVYRKEEIQQVSDDEGKYKDSEDEESGNKVPFGIMFGAVKPDNNEREEQIKRNDIEFWRYARLNIFSIYAQRCPLSDAVELTTTAITALVKEQKEFEKKYK